MTAGRLGYPKLATGVLRHKHNPSASDSTIEERSTLIDIRRFLTGGVNINLAEMASSTLMGCTLWKPTIIAILQEDG